MLRQISSRNRLPFRGHRMWRDSGLLRHSLSPSIEKHSLPYSANKMDGLRLVTAYPSLSKLTSSIAILLDPAKPNEIRLTPILIYVTMRNS
jgi:hypothetical protein